MEKKKYEKPHSQAVSIKSRLMQDTVSVNTNVWGDQSKADSRRYVNKLWDDEEELW